MTTEPHAEPSPAPDAEEPALQADAETPPYGKVRFSAIQKEEIPFGKPPEEEVTLVGEVPWELRDGADPSEPE
jgi:hypothetical protein